MSTPVCSTCEHMKNWGHSRDTLQFYCGLGANPTLVNDVKDVLWIPCKWSPIFDKMVTSAKTSPKWCPLRDKQRKEKRRARFYHPDGTPKYVACWEYKKQSDGERYTVTFQHAGKTDKLFPGHVTGLGMNAEPYHGICTRFDVPGGRTSFGTRISFKALPEECKRLVIAEYDYIWDLK